ncbi:MAG: acyltransferase [Lachnospiraceae bacterium]|jgi:peptidoglycan/LPS O-acetylase OafA/YrhL|nr:acyltransferase [Lachnospiraceae bacterium]
MAENRYNKKNRAEERAPKRLFYLDVIRAAAAVLIVIYHFSYSIFLPPPFQEVDILHGTVNGSWGMTPVYCFFMVSGASLMSRYGNEEKLDIRKFYKKRFLGIYPLFWIAYVIGFFAVYWQLGHLYEIPSWSLIWSVTGLDGWIVNWIPTFYMVGEWFLGSIVMLYLVFPPIRYCWRKNRKLTMAVSAAGAGILFWYHPFPMDIKQNPVIDLFYFLLGAWIEEQRKQLSKAGMPEKGGLLKLKRGQFLIWCASFIVLAVWFFLPIARNLPSMELTVSAQASGIFMFMRQSFILICTCGFYIWIAGISGWLEKSFHMKKIILEISGKSYGIFLTHHMVSQLICRHFDGANSSKREILGILVLVFLVTWMVTLFVYRIESYIKEKF